jgi:hypothetical protein
MRYLLLAVIHTIMFSTMVWAAPTVFLKDGTKVTGNSVWQEGDRVYLSKSKELYEFSQEDVKLQETMKFNRIGTYQDVSMEERKSRSASVAKKIRRPDRPAITKTESNVENPAVAPVKTPLPAATPVTNVPTAPKPAPPAPVVKAEASPAVAQPSAAETQKNSVPQPPTMQQPGGGFSIAVLLIALVICLILVAANWMIFEKAGQAGWKCLVPIYNMYVLMVVAGKPWWWFLLLFVPLVGAVIYLLAMLSLAKRFGRSELFGVGLFLLPIIFMPLLAFGDSQYQG